MKTPYQIIEIREEVDSPEDLGTKEKFWYTWQGQKWLFKKSRPLTGEHWSEKVAEQLCQKLGIPHTTYELASFQGNVGVTCPSIIKDRSGWRMTLGNQLLMSSDNTYPGNEQKRFVRVREHTVARVMGILETAKSGILPPFQGKFPEFMDAAGVFTGYLMLDALISNQDRHHENWAVLLDDGTGKKYLCPTYDHASSLGCTERDATRQQRLTTKDPGFSVAAYVKKAGCALYKSKADKKPLKTIDAFMIASEIHPRAGEFWLNKLSLLDEAETGQLLQ
ncbi:hypothetical protein [Endozoicomonas sp. 4G]|uniref:hypothetical protein n=1 Tax=Endozoicomonas sp. 4G TaxID=2872754 RepID=UPI002078C849|nr:hypothetical protein [Endozoicomonas sp. 4G]